MDNVTVASGGGEFGIYELEPGAAVDLSQTGVYAQSVELYGKDGLSPALLRLTASRMCQRHVEPLEGGGPGCPSCGKRALVRLEGKRPGLRQCGACGIGVLLKVTGDGIKLLALEEGSLA